MTTSLGLSWFAPAPSTSSIRRLSLDLGLRRADLWFRELVVPQLGGVWFVRQLSWPVAALALHGQLRAAHGSAPRPTIIARGIEALACKLDYEADRQAPRILGTRAFGREPSGEGRGFAQLRRPENYVRNTHRQVASRVLRTERGLGLVTGSRFDTFALTEVGQKLAEAVLHQEVGQGKTTLQNFLLQWLRGAKSVPSNPGSLRRALSPNLPTTDEQQVVRGRLFGTDASSRATQKRIRLEKAIVKSKGAPDPERSVVKRLRAQGDAAQADEVMAALGFGAMLDRGRDVLARMTELIGPAPTGAPLAKLASDGATRAGVAALVKMSADFTKRAEVAKVREPTSDKFAHAITSADATTVLRILAKRSGGLVAVADDAAIRGTRFKRIAPSHDDGEPDEGAAGLAPDRTARSFRIANLHALILDLQPRKPS